MATAIAPTNTAHPNTLPPACKSLREPWRGSLNHRPMKPPIVATQSYGKSQVRVSRIERHGAHREFTELTVWIELEGDFASSYSAADNSNVVATDTMKNTVYVLASRHGIKSGEAFAQLLGKHFLGTYSHVNRVTVR